MAGVASSSRQRSKIAPYLMILPALVYLGIFFVVPFFSLVRRRCRRRAVRCTCRRWTFAWNFSNYGHAFSALPRIRSSGRSRTRWWRPWCACCWHIPLAYVIAFKAGRYKNLILGSGHPAVLRDVPDPHHRVEDHPRRRWLGGQYARRRRPAARRRQTAVHELGGDRRIDLQLDHFHDPAAVREPGEDRSAADRGVEGPVLVEHPRLHAR